MAYEKVCHLTSVHSREDNRILLKECVSLDEIGYNVFLIVADGLGDEKYFGISIIDVGKLNRRIARMCLTPFKILIRARRLKADIYHFHDPELLPIGLLLTWSGSQVIYDAHEDVPRQILSKHWIPASLRPLVSWSIEKLENCIVKRLAGVITSTPHIAARFKIINANTVDINNYPRPEELAPLKEKHERKRQICYVGGLTKVRGIEPLIRALPSVPDATLVLCGRFAESSFEVSMRLLPGWKQVDFRGFVDRDDIRCVLTESVAGIVTLFPIVNYFDSLPIKMFEYMSAELPVIASDFPLWREIIDGAGAGLCVDPESPEAIAAAIRRLADDPDLVEKLGKSGRAAILSKYNWPGEAQKLIKFYKELL